VLPRETLEKVIARARKHGTYVFADECYSEIWLGDKVPTGALEACGAKLRQRDRLSIHSPSARTCPVCAAASPRATRKFISAYAELRNVAAPQVPEPLQEVAIAAYSDEYHVEDTRKLYREKFDLADACSASASTTSGPKAASFFGSTSPNSATTKPPKALFRTPGSASFPAAISRERQATAPIPARATSASHSSTT
jgi:aspartate/methionine/tyrosine aminotransferase